jgi:predicted kinase
MCAVEVAPIIVVSGPAGVGKSTVAGLCAAAFERGVHLRSDDFLYAVVSGFVDPSSAEATCQNETVGGALGAAAIQFAVGGYTVLADGTFFPSGVEGFAAMAARKGVALHYAVLRADLATCSDRAAERGAMPDQDASARLHERLSDLGRYEANVIDATASPEDVAAQVLALVDAGRALVRP